MGWIAGVDVGGTFTDILLANDCTGQRLRHKVPSNPADPSQAIVAGVAALAARQGVDMAGLVRLAHGTTVATNALIERRGGVVTLITTAGFRDVLEIGRQTRPKLYDFKADHPEPLVPRQRRLEVRERVGPAGEVIEPLEEAEVRRLIAAVAATGSTCVAVGLLFSFANPAHERQIGLALRCALPDVAVSLSSDVQPEFREYERISTTVLNAFLQPVVAAYVRALDSSLKGYTGATRLDICQSSGGLMSVDRAAEMPIRTALSGPAAGVIGARGVAAVAGYRNVITFDMGGTSTDVCLIRDGSAEIDFGRTVAGFPVRLPSIDIHTVGAGGGSVAYVGRDGLLKVGPRSAGVDPGPACYGRGGREATVSDANLVLGRLPRQLVGGAMTLDMACAELAIASLAKSLDLASVSAALGVVRIVNANMVRAIRVVSIERGYDPRDFALMAFGGAGPLHAVEVAREIGIATVLLPPSPGLLCAEGVAAADLEESFVATVRNVLSGDLADVRAVVDRLLQAADRWFADNGIGVQRRNRRLTMDLRYVGQNYELPVAVELDGSELRSDLLRQAFDELHLSRYGHNDASAKVELINVRLAVGGRFPDLPAPAAAPTQGRPQFEAPANGLAWFEDKAPTPLPLIDRGSLAVGDTIEGPAIVTQLDATCLLPPGCRGKVLPCTSILLEVRS